MENSASADKPTTNRWVVIIGTILVQIAAGSFYAWAIFNNGFIARSGGVLDAATKTWSGGFAPASTSFTFTLGMLCLSLATLAGIPLAKKFGIKPVDAIVSVIYGLAILALLLVGKGSSIWVLWIFGGIVLGAMNGVLYLTTLTNAIKWFPERKGLISGISVASYGLGSFIFKYIDMGIAGGTGAITGDNVGRVVLWWAILAFILAFVGSLLLKDAPDAAPTASAAAAETDNADFTAVEMLKKPQSYMIFITLTTGVMFMGLLGAAVTNMAAVATQTPANVAVWAGSAAAATFVAIVAIFNTLGRFIMGWLSDIIGRKGVFFITYILQLIALIILIATKPGAMSMGLIYVVVIIMAFCFGGNITVFPTFVADYFGVKNSARNYSIIYQGFGIGAIVVGFLMASGNPLAPALLTLSNGAKVTQNFTVTYWVLLVMVVISLIIFAFIRKPKKA